MKIFIIIVIATFLSACSNSGAQPISTANTNAPAPRGERPQTLTAHSTENLPATPDPVSGSTPEPKKGSGDGEPIDMTKYNAAISKAGVAIKGGATDPASKKALAQAYFERGLALTEAKQYASALGDYRRAIKFDPTHADAKKWVDQLVNIYKSLNKEAPKEGEEPLPLPYDKP